MEQSRRRRIIAVLATSLVLASNAIAAESCRNAEFESAEAMADAATAHNSPDPDRSKGLIESAIKHAQESIRAATLCECVKVKAPMEQSLDHAKDAYAATESGEMQDHLNRMVNAAEKGRMAAEECWRAQARAEMAEKTASSTKK